MKSADFFVGCETNVDFVVSSWFFFQCLCTCYYCHPPQTGEMHKLHRLSKIHSLEVDADWPAPTLRSNKSLKFKYLLATLRHYAFNFIDNFLHTEAALWVYYVLCSYFRYNVALHWHCWLDLSKGVCENSNVVIVFKHCGTYSGTATMWMNVCSTGQVHSHIFFFV